MSVNNQDNDTNGSKVRNVDHLNRLQVLFVNRICNFHLHWNSVFSGSPSFFVYVLR